MNRELPDNLLLTAIKASLKAGKAILKVYHSSEIEITIKSDNSPLTLADRNAHFEIDKILSKSKLPILSEEGKNIRYETRKHWEYYWLVDPLDGTKEFIKHNGEFTVNIALINDSTPILGVIYAPVQDKMYFASRSRGSYRIDDFSKLKYAINDLNFLIKSAINLNVKHNKSNFQVIASRSHLYPKTVEFINKIKKQHNNIEYLSKGSSLKFCLIADGEADLYPRFGPTMEWDTAAGHAIVQFSGGNVLDFESEKPLEYNKKSLLNPAFVVYAK
jgi:3'(2'), 5'-bisphosphate nucleotidase